MVTRPKPPLALSAHHFRYGSVTGHRSENSPERRLSDSLSDRTRPKGQTQRGPGWYRAPSCRDRRERLETTTRSGRTWGVQNLTILRRMSDTRPGPWRRLDGLFDTQLVSAWRALRVCFALRKLLFGHRGEQRKEDGKRRPARYRPPRRRLQDVATLVVQGEVESFGLLILGHTQTHRHIDDLQNSEADDPTIYQSR